MAICRSAALCGGRGSGRRRIVRLLQRCIVLPGIVLLGIVRTLCSETLKLVLPKLLPVDLALVTRKYLVAALAALWVFTVHPAALASKLY